MRYMEMSPEQLREAYRVAKTGAYAAGQLSQRVPYRAHGYGDRVARSMARNLDMMTLIERCADKRGISLTAPTDENT
jgi:hypothetical protein